MCRLIQYLTFPVCIGCGSFFQKDHLFCDHCFTAKIQNRILLTTNQNLPQHRYLISWNPGESDLVSNYVYCLKRIKAPKAWAYFARYMAFSLIENDYDLIVPIPSSSRLSKHSHFFAGFLAKEMKIPYLNLIRKQDLNKVQKKLTKSERQFVAITRCEQFTTTDFRSKRVLLVDDILTTGASYNAAQNAIGPTQKTDLLTLFFRKPK